MNRMAKLVRFLKIERGKRRQFEVVEDKLWDPIDPELLVSKIGAEEHFNSGKFGFARESRENYWNIVKPMLIYAASLYQGLPATVYAHHKKNTD